MYSSEYESRIVDPLGIIVGSREENSGKRPINETINQIGPGASYICPVFEYTVPSPL
jgi:hypothetical protein